MDRVKREISILNSLKHLENVIQLYDVVYDHGSQTISLVFEYFTLVDFYKIFLKLNDVQIKMYLFEILQVVFQKNKFITPIFLRLLTKYILVVSCIEISNQAI